jgi:hypothetical protein
MGIQSARRIPLMHANDNQKKGKKPWNGKRCLYSPDSGFDMGSLPRSALEAAQHTLSRSMTLFYQKFTVRNFLASGNEKNIFF